MNRLGSSYVNDFMDRGRVKKAYVQAAAPYRMLPDDINLWYVRNKDGGMVPFCFRDLNAGRQARRV